jgi:hypothetical protein
MVYIDQVLEARVMRVEEYGLFLEHNGEELFVHLPELTVYGNHRVPFIYSVNQSLKVRVLKKHPDKNLWLASTLGLSMTHEIDITVRFDTKVGVQFTGVDEANDLIAQGGKVISIRKGDVILTKVDEDSETVQLAVDGFKSTALIEL